MKRIVSLVLSFTMLTGCMAQQKPVTELLPTQARYDSDALEQQDPSTRYADFERQYREGEYQDPYWPLAAQYEGIGQLVMPPSARPEAAWAYISLGKDFVTKGDLGGATRAYWAALELVSRTIASRPDRERIVRAAYEGLESVAGARGQKKWGKLMRFCSHLAGAYLDSPQVEEDNAAFYTQINTIKTAQQDMEKAQSETNSQLVSGLLMTAVSGLGAAGAAMNHDSLGFQNYTSQGVNQLVESHSNYRKAADLIKELTDKSAQQYKDLRMAVASDVEEVDAAHSFVANEFLFYVKNTKAPGPYLQLLGRFARNKPQLKKVLAVDEDPSKIKVTPEFLTSVRDELVRVEKFVAQYERRSKVSPLEVAKVVWTD
jgi:hypothetical protein